MAKAKYRTPAHRAAYLEYKHAQADGQWLLCVEPTCLMPTRAIAPSMPVDVCHDPTGTYITGPGHAKCNRSEGAARGNRMRRVIRTTRWAL